MTHSRMTWAGACLTALLAFNTSARADTDRYIVQFAERGASEARRALSAAGAEVVLDLQSVNAAAVNIPAQALNGLRNNPNIAWIETDPKRYPMSLGTTQSEPWGIAAVQADLVAYDPLGGAKVCVIDSGYDNTHPDLPALGAGDGSSGSAGPWDQDGLGHGTHVAGTIAALDNGFGVVGVNKDGNLPLHIVRVFNDGGSFSYASGLVAALADCENAGANVINMSLGGSVKSRTEDRAFSDADRRGVLSIAAAGNDGNNRHSYPASYNSVVSVAAVDESLNHASFSQTTSQVELAGPGVHVLSTVPVGTGAEASAVVGTTTYLGDAMDGSPAGTGSGPLTDCGIGDSPCPGGAGQVCLIQRGTVTFAEKVQACQSGGGAAAIIYNNEPGPLLGTLGETATSIPSLGVSDADGAAMLGQLGQNTTVTVDVSDYAFFDGTSMATPHVAGVAALVWSHHPGCSNQQVREALQASALDLGALGRDDQFGHGLVQAADAIAALAGSACGGGNGGTDAVIDSFTASPDRIEEGESTTLSWSSSNTTSCSGDWTGAALGTSGSDTLTLGTAGDYVFTLSCTDGTTTDSASVTVSVKAPKGGGGGGGGKPCNPRKEVCG